MKIVKNSFWLLFVLSCFVNCQNSNLFNNETIATDTVFIEKNDTIYIDNNTYVNYEKDSVFYVTYAILPDEIYGDTFLITKTIWVEDSCFGVLNEFNRNNAYNFNHNRMTYTFHIHLLDEGKSNNFLNITNVHYSREIRLDRGYGNNYLGKNVKEHFLRIILKTNYDELSLISLNYIFDDDLKSKHISKERIHVKKLHNQDTRKIGYCLDTLVINKRTLDWNRIVDTYSWQVCQ